MGAREVFDARNGPEIVISVVIWGKDSGRFKCTFVTVEEVGEAVVVTIIKADAVAVGIKLIRIADAVAITVGIFLVGNAVAVLIGKATTSTWGAAFVYIEDAVTI